MSETVNKESMQFKTEVNQLLQLMIHSLYSNKEIFLRELVSNGADACDKLRFEAVSNDKLYEDDSELRIEIEADKEAGTVTIRDNGIGMNREELVENIGTIANSGTKKFLEKLDGEKAKDANMIGQFGVGFYSAFIVADKVTLTSRRAGDPVDSATRWESDASESYTLENVTQEKRGTEIVLHLKEDEKSLADEWQLKSIAKKYSDHIAVAINMKKEPETNDEGEEIQSDTVEWETINKAEALWRRSKNDITTEEYNDFYKHLTYDFQDPMTWSHNQVEGNLEYTSLLYIPSKAPFDLWEQTQKNGIKLYVQRVFIMDDTENLMPRYLRFVRGLIDSNNLPLNVSREILQSNRTIDSMRKASVKKVLGLLEKMAKNKPEEYQEFWNEFGNAVKEGPGEDFENREKIAGLLRFASTSGTDDTQNVSLADYVSRMREQQDKIYYITAESYAAAKNSPHLEVFKKKDIEVLLLSDRVDEWLSSHLNEFEGKSLQSVSKGDLDLSKFESEEDKKEQETVEKEAEDILKRLKDVLADKVEEVKVSHRLTDSPSCVVLKDQDMALYMQQMLKQAGHEMPSSKPTLEINPKHPLINKMQAESNDEAFSDWASVLFDQALLAEGAQLEDPAGFVSKLNTLMLGKVA